VARHLSENNQIIIDDLDLRGHEAEIEDQKEKEADRIAEEALIPSTMIEQSFFAARVPASGVEALAEKLKIHPAIVAGRIRFNTKNYRLLSKYVGNGQVRRHFPEFT
jgi:HTH-type transcriptional regulator/antitoxin HigA